jgi:alkylhydroperoxidase family enzyme
MKTIDRILAFRDAVLAIPHVIAEEVAAASGTTDVQAVEAILVRELTKAAALLTVEHLKG